MRDDGRLKILAVFAHPDDESLLAGGTLAGLAAAGHEVVLICATHGEQGPIADPSVATRETLGAVREAELKSAARELGVRHVECLRYPDGELSWVQAEDIEADLVQQIRRRQPDVVITFGPEGLYWHPDHVAVHRFTVAALDTLAGDGFSPWLYYATWPAGLVGELVAAMARRGQATDLWGLHPDDFGAPADSITTVLDVRPFLAAKLRALYSHRSQLGPNHLLRNLPDELAEQFLGSEYFVRAVNGLPACPCEARVAPPINGEADKDIADARIAYDGHRPIRSSVNLWNDPLTDIRLSSHA